MLSSTRARKKKCLTDPVSIIPFPNQNIRKKAPSKKAVAPTPVQKVNFQRPQHKEIKAPTGNLRQSSVSIKKMLTPQTGSETSPLNYKDDLPQEPYNLDDLKMAWRRYAYILKERGEKTFYNSLLKRDPIPKSEHLFTLEVDNHIQIETVKQGFNAFINYLRSELKNHSLSIEVVITQNTEKEIKFQTGKDKFASLARKNPNLHAFRKMFNLDVDY